MSKSEQPELTVAAAKSAAAAKTNLTKDGQLVEYEFQGKLWRCEKFDDLAAEFDGALKPEHLAIFHEKFSTQERSWKILRRLFGIQPILPGMDSDVADERLWSRKELMEDWGINKKQLAEDFQVMRGAWRPVARGFEPVETQKLTVPETKIDWVLGDDPILKEFNFHKIRFKDIEEREKFTGWVKNFERVLRENIVSGMATNALMTRLSLERLRSELINDPDNYYQHSRPRRREDEAAAQKMGQEYNDAIVQILDKCPWASEIAGKHGIRPVISAITEGILAYRARQETRLIDGIFTAMEIQVECRMSLQMPLPRYRAGLVMACMSAREGLFDKNYKPPYTEAELKRLDHAWQNAYKEISLSDGVKIPDLESDDPEAGEYAELIVAPEPVIQK